MNQSNYIDLFSSAQVLGPTCGDKYSSMRFFDIAFNSEIDWNDSGLAHMESTALHELGHAQFLNHTLNGEDKVMHPSKTIVVTNLSIDDHDGGEHSALLGSSNLFNNCIYPDPMVLIDVNSCNIPSTTNSFKFEESIQLYPNPTTGMLYVDIPELFNTNDKYLISIYDINGELVFT